MAAPGPLASSRTSLTLIRKVDLLDELLAAHSGQLGLDFESYRGHCYRVLNFCLALSPGAPVCHEKLAITTAFHDIGIWTHGTFDYLAPSIEVATAYLSDSGKEHWTDEVRLAVQEHHKICRTPHGSGTLVESFRRADWIDVSAGVLSFGLPRKLIREAFSIWPSSGFHLKLIRLSWQRAKAHPLSPLPMLKF